VSTVGTVLRRLGLGRLSALEAKPPVVRYERSAAGELRHIDTKKLGRIAGFGHRVTGDRRGHRARGVGWEYLHGAIDDASRLAYTELLPDERGASCAGFLTRAAAWFASLGVRIERVITDNAFAYTKSRLFRAAMAQLGARHLTTKPYRPRPNGKAERFIQTALREWLYASSAERAHDRSAWLHWYNHHRPHAGIHAATPASRLNNLLGNNR
jgi:transposase InsO family protein